MSRQDDEICETCRSRAFDYRHGTLEEEERDRIRRHVNECETCRDYYDKLDLLLESAREVEPVEDPADADAMFDRIAAEIEEREAAPSTSHETSAPSEPSESEGSSATPWRGHGRVAAAALVAGLLLGYAAMQWWSAADPSEEAVAERNDEEADEPPSDQPERRAEKPPPDSEDSRRDASAFADLRAVELEEEVAGRHLESSREETTDGGDTARSPRTVEMFASPEARWDLTGDGELRLSVERGVVLVEFLPREDRGLRVSAPGLEIRVTGTVFFVEARTSGSRAGVLTGSLDVEGTSGETLALSEGEEVDEVLERRPVPESARRRFSKYVDLEEHRRRLADLRATETSDREEHSEASPPDASKPPGRQSTDRSEQRAERRGEATAAVPPSTDGPTGSERGAQELSALRRRADRAASRGKYDRAAALYREFLDRAPNDHSGAPAVHLDLANLLMHRLDRSAEAVPHLRTFVQRWPNDVAAPSAREELCRLTRRLDAFAPECEGVQE